MSVNAVCCWKWCIWEAGIKKYKAYEAALCVRSGICLASQPVANYIHRVPLHAAVFLLTDQHYSVSPKRPAACLVLTNQGFLQLNPFFALFSLKVVHCLQGCFLSTAFHRCCQIEVVQPWPFYNGADFWCWTQGLSETRVVLVVFVFVFG